MADQLWLVKSSNRILGPFAFSEVVALIHSRELYLLDEVCRPLKRWVSFQECDEFRDAIEEMRKKGFSTSEDTSSINDGFTNRGLTATVPVEIEYADEFTDEMAFAENASREIVYDSVVETKSKQSVNASPSTGVTVYGSKNSAQFAKDVQSKTRFIPALLFFLAACGFGILGYQYFYRKPKMVESVAQDDYDKGMYAMDEGDYAQALDRFSRYSGKFHDTKKVALYLGPLLIQLENQTVQGQQLLQEALSADPNSLAQVQTGIGLAEMINGHYEQAREAFDKALDSNPYFYPALINKGSLALLRQDYTNAKNTFESVVNKTDTEPEAFMLLADTLLNSGKEEMIDEAISELSDFLKTATDYSQEARLSLAYAYSLKKNSEKTLRTVMQLLDSDPKLTEDHRHNLFIFSRRLTWTNYLRWCDSVHTSMAQNVLGTSLYAYCLYRSDRAMDAKQTMETAVQQSPKDALVQALYSFILRSSNLDDQASVALGKSIEYDSHNEYQLPLILQAQFCEKQKDYACATKNWSRILATYPEHLTAIAGLAQNHMDTGENSDVAALIAKGLTISPDYRPLRKLVHKAESLGLKVVK